MLCQVSPHPDTVDAMGTKQALHRARGLDIALSDTAVYHNSAEMSEALPGLLARGARMIKQNSGCQGEWSVGEVKCGVGEGIFWVSADPWELIVNHLIKCAGER